MVFRVTDGKGKAAQGRKKYSTQVSIIEYEDSTEMKTLLSDAFPSICKVLPEEVLTFQERCSTILRTSFASFLKKRDKAKERRADKVLKDLRKRMEETDKIKVTSIGSSESPHLQRQM